MSITAMTRVVFDPDVYDEVIELGKQALRIFEQQPGFICIRQFKVMDKSEILTMVEFESELAYRSCQESPDWLMLMPQWCALQEDGEVTLQTSLLEQL